MPDNNGKEARKATMKKELEEMERNVESRITRMKETEARLKRKLEE